MRARSAALRIIAVPLIMASMCGIGFPADQSKAASRKRTQTRRPATETKKKTETTTATATNVSAELTAGKLSTDNSRTGDRVLVKLSSDVKSNGVVVLKKGTTIVGIVRNTRQGDGTHEKPGLMESLVVVEWVVPKEAVKAPHEVMIALQAIQQSVSASRNEAAEAAESTATADQLPAPPLTAEMSNVALMSMPSIVTADQQMASTLQSALGFGEDERLFRTGRGYVTTGGLMQSLNIFSRLRNDTVISSQSKSFEITRGAQLHLLIGIRKK